MPRLATVSILFAFTAPAVAQEAALDKARERVRALQTEIERTIEKVVPSVGAVLNYSTVLDPKTGRVTMRPRSLGSGVVIARGGFFLTNVHVIEHAGYLTVTLPGGILCRAVLFSDTSSGKVKGDIALLKLQHPTHKRFEFVDWRSGNPQWLAPGSFVFAMGNPHGHARDGTPVITMGILSGKGRAAAERGYLYVDALQTDAEINPGNSGGPLFDARGNLIGINGLMASRAGRSNSGVGFAIPMDQIRLFLRRLLKDEGGGVGYGFHGLQVASTVGERGVTVMRVDSKSPAAAAGMRPGDVIRRVNRKKVGNRSDFINLVGKLPEGTAVTFSYRRKRKPRTARLRLVSYADYLARMGRTSRRSGPLPLPERGYLGFEWTSGRGGLRIRKVVPKTGASAAGLAKGDLVETVAGKAVGDPAALLERLAAFAAGEKVALTYTRKGIAKTVTIELCDAAQAAGIAE